MTVRRVDERLVDRISAAVAGDTGLSVGGVMRARLGWQLARAAERTGTSADEYAAAVLADPARLRPLVEELTVHESTFFRHADQFQALAGDVLPHLDRPIRVWSCGCAYGQEPYSLAMLLLEGNYRDASVIATDVSEPALAGARAGRYATRDLRGLSAERRAAWLEPDGDQWSVRPVVRRLVRFERHNLAKDQPPFQLGECQVIFCRNVLIYFHERALVDTIDRLRGWLPDGGLLFLGQAESLWQVTDRFEPVQFDNVFAYRKPGAQTRRPGASAVPAVPSAVPVVPSAVPVVPPAVPVVPPAVPVGPAAPRTAAVEPAAGREVPALMRRGELAMAAGDTAAAVNAFRQAAYLDPAQPVAHFQLGLALEAQGATGPAARAYRAARTALRRLDPASHPPELRGYRTDVLIRLIDAQLEGARR